VSDFVIGSCEKPGKNKHKSIAGRINLFMALKRSVKNDYEYKQIIRSAK
jgi:hypothetical protein